MAISINMGERIRFQSLAPTDPNIYVGRVKGLITADIAIKQADIISKTNAVAQAGGAVANLNYRDLSYFIIGRESTTSNTVVDTVFAVEWINEASFSSLDNLITAEISLIGVTSEELQNAVELLQAEGMAVRITSTGDA